MRLRLLLLWGQTISLGLMMAFLVVPASSLFLDEYGADTLPYAYLAVAVSGVLVSSAMSRAQRGWSLARLSITVLTVYAVVVATGWAVLATGASWVTFPLIVMFPLSIPIGFVIVGSQAGRLLDVRQMKSSFPRVVAGFSVGFALGGLLSVPLVELLGGPVHLLGLDVLATLGFISLVIETARRHPAELRTPPPPSTGMSSPPQPSVHSLMRNPMVVLIFGYQILSAAVTQLLDFMVWERAAARYPDPSDLAQFLGVFGAIINVVSIAFVALLGGWLLTRYGLRLGLAANPAGVLALLAVSAVAGYGAGLATTIFFVLVCAQQVTDISLTDGTTRTSINATYQALSPAERLAAQTRIEGAGVPLALGFVGVVLLIFDWLSLDVRALVLFTLVLSLAWLVFAVLAYTEYGVNLRTSLARRAWDPVALRIDDQASRDVVERLLASPDLRDVRTGLDVLVDVGDRSLSTRATALLADADPARRELGVEVARRAWLGSLTDTVAGIAADRGAPSSLRAHAARVAGELGGRAQSARLLPLLRDADHQVRFGVAAGLLSSVEHAGDESRRMFADALRGDDLEETESAVRAAAASPHPFLAPYLVDLADRSPPAGDLPEALRANSTEVASIALAALNGRRLSRRAHLEIVRAVDGGAGPAARTLLLRQLTAADPELSEAALRGLLASGYRVDADADLVRREVVVCVERAALALDAASVFGAVGPCQPLARALADEVAAAGRRMTALLGLLHDPGAVTKAVEQLRSPVEAERALAIEMLEVTVGRHDTPAILAVVDPQLGLRSRRGALARVVRVEHLDRPTRLRDLVVDASGRWHDPWLRACALYAAADLLSAEAAELALPWVDDADPVVAETARWVCAVTLSRAVETQSG